MDRHPPLGELLLAMALLPLAASNAAAAISGRVVGADGKGIAQAVVFVNDPVAPAAAPSGSTAEMDQINKTFVPGVLPVVVGTLVHFPNRDQIHHHVYSFSRTKTFELPLYKGEDAPPVLFDKVGVVKVACNIHDWMSGIILVLPSPHYAMTDADGRFTLTGVPPGAHTLAAWHAQNRGKLEDNMQRVEVSDAALEVNFTLNLDAARSRPAVSGARKDP
ncbi:MAG TPA: carboxypeptidase regulatory-like domain-containing protein [Steroidobacteraceae bacterium]|nr:carboxypeptidase regulatory-like domain-containing protein [Steroidobacteraceae bacterium]